MQEHELWLTALFNNYLGGLANSILALVGTHAENPAKPWKNYIVMEILVTLLLMVVAAILRPKLSMDKPGKLQNVFEEVWGFLHGQASESVGHHYRKYIYLLGALFLFILASNLLGMIPGFESPTMFAPVPLGCAIVTFIYYNAMGVAENGPIKYAAHFGGPIWWLSPLMFPIEILSNLSRLLSLTARLFANMFGGEQVTLAFMRLIPLGVPVIFMGLHTFVAFLQAYVFVLLTMIYLNQATSHEH
jgi:F-type H+-transporting ATPase subunit a